MREARITEKQNAASLALLMSIEDKAKTVDKKVRVVSGPAIRTFSSKIKTGGGTVLAFKDCTPKAYFNLNDYPDPQREDLCVMTKRKARYKDPLTGQPYYDLQSFKALRKAKKLKTKPL